MEEARGFLCETSVLNLVPLLMSIYRFAAFNLSIYAAEIKKKNDYSGKSIKLNLEFIH